MNCFKKEKLLHFTPPALTDKDPILLCIVILSLHITLSLSGKRGLKNYTLNALLQT